MSSARSAPPPATPAWLASAPPPRPKPPTAAASTTKPASSRNWPPATRPCTTSTPNARPTFAAVMADRADWDAATRAQRHLAVAADAELRRRHPDRQYPPLRSAEPPRPTQAQRDELTLTTGEQIRETGQWIKGPGRPAPRVRRQAGRPAEPDHPVRRPRLWRPRPGLPALASTIKGRHPATA